MDDSKRARSWKRRIQTRIDLKNDAPVLYSTHLRNAITCPYIPSNNAQR